MSVPCPLCETLRQKRDALLRRAEAVAAKEVQVSESDTIVLPRSGTVLCVVTRNMADAIVWWCDRSGQFRIGRSGAIYCASAPGNALSGAALDEAIAHLDSRVLALREAILPPGALVVVPERDRERIARAVYGFAIEIANEPSRECECEWDHARDPDYAELCDVCKSGPRDYADAVLAALREPLP